MNLVYVECREKQGGEDGYGVVRPWTVLEHYYNEGKDRNPCNVDAVDEDRNTALHLAAIAGHKGSVMRVHSIGEARLDIYNNAGQTALIAAAANDQAEVMRFWGVR